MRRQAKPFMVEIKKSRKSGGSPEPLLGFLDKRTETTESPSEAAAAIATQKLFGRSSDTPRVLPDAPRLFQSDSLSVEAAAANQARNRILPDLSRIEKPAEAAPIEAAIPSGSQRSPASRTVSP